MMKANSKDFVASSNANNVQYMQQSKRLTTALELIQLKTYI
jgi:hypothetical protein